MLLLLSLACTPDEKLPGDDTGSADTDVTDTDTDTTDTDTDTTDTDTTDTDTAPRDDDDDGVLSDVDCDDTDPDVYPGATEVCDEVDQDCDGLVDEGTPSVAYLAETIVSGAPSTGGAWYGYDAADYNVLIGSDPEADGVLNSYIRYEWTDGLFMAEEHSNDGVNKSYRIEYTRQEDGYVTEGRADNEGDGDWDWAYGYRYVDGVYAGYWYDNGYDGVYEIEQRYEYDDAGILTRYWEDSDGDGTIDYESLYIYDGELRTSIETDTDGDGVFESEVLYTYEDTRLIEEVQSGAYASRRTYSYTDADDQYDQIELDIGDDGSLDWRYTYTWDGEAVIGQTYDELGDGVGVLEYTYTYDENGLTLTADTAVDGTYTTFTAYEWNGTALAGYRTDVNADGTWDNVTLYNARGTYTYASTDATGDGTVDILNRIDEDTRLRRVGASQDNPADGVLEYEQVIQGGYVCGEK